MTTIFLTKTNCTNCGKQSTFERFDTVFDDKLTVEFKSGVEIDIEIQDIRNGDQLRGVTSLIGGFSYLRIDFDCEYTYNNINNVVDIIINKEWTT